MRRVLFIFTWLTLGALPAVAQNSLYADPRAFRQGDLLTIILAERTAAQRESNYEQAANTKLGGAAAVSGSLGGRFGLDATFVHEGKSRNETLQRDLLTGTVTAIVVGVDTTGNLLIEGERRLNVNGVTHLMRISGLVRPLDVRYDNTVFSYQIAQARIEYHQSDGLTRKFFRPGFFTRLGALVLLGAAIAWGTQ
ncbi:flagellar basal body L-ring protein FlgH [Rhodothermus bifroesti]|uniref:Flagellar basal body L-ring protein FlgH n=1 Tax=Rhodothermus marinus TaxID=29549 RepID=A0A7V2AYU4_RHOMR|nr:flagellar basal body L-ring protein FlgH [Rhodothermus bifroesti]GBD00749.1 Flagellar L-ring protein [bacterium HR18]